jgi:2-phosphosulfolactate phosphatase
MRGEHDLVVLFARSLEPAGTQSAGGPDVTPFDQREWACRSEWGVQAVAGLAPADVTIVVDVLSFSTCVDVAASRGVAILPYRWTAWDDPAAAAYALEQGAELAGKRRRTRYSLAPSSYLDAPRGLRCVLRSPNGAGVCLAAGAAGGPLLAGCLRNAGAVAGAAQAIGRTFNVVPAGERWLGGALRPSLEDAIGAGAILQRLPGTRSPEADWAVAVFERFKTELRDVLDRCGSGRELDERGHRDDVALAGALDVSDCVPRFDGVAFTA